MTATTRLSTPVSDRRPQLRSHRRRANRSTIEGSLSSSSRDIILDQRKPNAEDLRRMRAEYYTATPDDRQKRFQKTMTENSTPRRTSSARIPSNKTAEVTTQGVRAVRSSDHRHRRRRTRAEEQDSELEPVYVYHTKSNAPEPPRLRRSRTTTTATASRPKELRLSSNGLARSHTERRKSRHKEDVITVKRIVRAEHQPEPESVYKSYRSRPSISRSALNRDAASVNPTRPSLLRSQTTTRKVRPPVSTTPFPPSTGDKHGPTPSVASRTQKSSGFFGSILGIAKDPPAPEKHAECLTCLSSYPVSRTARLACNHRMCHACLRRIFTLSITDPQHMPPKCCTQEHIPLKHVDKLFDLKFKMKWNQKYQEDDATKQFIEIAKKEGWQRCYNCSATVELKEGCNHMTCRCKAEFCMICGVKWKGCDCPWFNYQTVVQDRLNHMNVPVIQRVFVDGQEVDADHPRAARGYQAELDARREQERRDEQLARRLQTLGLDPPGVEIYQVIDDDHNDHNYGFRIGNTTGHHMNMQFVPHPATHAPSAPYRSASQAQPTYPSVPQPQPQPLLRQHSQASRAYNNHHAIRAAERVVPRRSASDYQHEAAVHAPLRSATVGLRREEPRGSALAGLTSGGTAEGRVDEWRRWVDVG
ncbi:MAG: hypothetical protein Q9171_002672 [Xanthocarpia ochracea]